MSNAWISVTDKLPNTDDYILAVIEDYSVWDDSIGDIKIAPTLQSVKTYVAWYANGWLTWLSRDGESCMKGTESHYGDKWAYWMPIPAPPEEEEKK